MRRNNLWGILLLVATFGITLALWSTATPVASISTLDHIRQIIGALGLIGLGSCFVIATKAPFVEKWLHGLDRAYVLHKWLAIGSVSLLMVHAILKGVIDLIEGARPDTLASGLGGFALFLFIAIGLVTLYYKKLPYEKWRVVHRFMLAAYVIALYHAYASSKFALLTFSPLGVWTGVTAAIGLAAGVYVVFFYRRTQFKHTGVVTQVNRLGTDVVELLVRLDKPMEFSEGQYAFVRVFQDGLENAPHPFSMSGGHGRDIRLTIKASGDFTRGLYDSVKPDTKIALAGPHGHMDFRIGGQKQLWIAGGIGITPFVSYLDQNDVTQDIEMFYSYRDKNAGIYADELTAYAARNPHFTLHLVDASVAGMLDFSGYTLEEGTVIYMCGPPPMMAAYTKYFKGISDSVTIIHEGFAFR